MVPVAWQLPSLEKIGFHRALGLAQRAVDALIRIDDEEVGAGVKAIDRAHLDTVHVFALDAIFRDDKSHCCSALGAGAGEAARSVLIRQDTSLARKASKRNCVRARIS